MTGGSGTAGVVAPAVTSERQPRVRHPHHPATAREHEHGEDHAHHYGEDSIGLALWLERIAFTVMLAVLTLLGWSFGGEDPVSFGLALWGTLLVLACCGVAAVLPGRRRSPSWLSMAPLLGLAVVTALQVMELPAPLLNGASPRVVQLRSEFGGPVANESWSGGAIGDTPGVPQVTSVDPPRTRRELVLVLAGLGLWIAAGQVVSTRNSLRGLCWYAALQGAALSYLGVLQKLTSPGSVYWGLEASREPFGPFVNRNNAAGYLGLCFAGAVALTYQTWVSRHSQRLSGGWRLWQQLVPPVLLVTIAVGILASRSRGGIAGLLLGLLVVAICLVRVRAPRGLLWGLPVLLVIVAAVLGFLSLGSGVSERLAGIEHAQHSLQQRLQLWGEAIQIGGDFWLTGSGLGSFGAIHPLYQGALGQFAFTNADNLPVELFAELGLPGIALMLLLLGLLVTATAQCAWWTGRHRSSSTVLLILGLFLVTNGVVCALADYGLRLPANFLLGCVLAASLCGMARAAAIRPRTITGLERSAHAVLLLAVGLSLLVAWHSTRGSGVSQLVVSRGRSEFDESEFRPEWVAQCLKALDLAIAAQPDDGPARVRAAEFHIVQCQLAMQERLKAEEGDELEGLDLWVLTSPAALHGRAAAFRREGDVEGLKELLEQPELQRHLRPAIEQLVRARRVAPLLGSAHLWLAQLAFLADNPETDALHLERVGRVAPANGKYQLRSGFLHLQAGREELALACWKRAIELSVEQLPAVIAALPPSVPRQRVIDELLPRDPLSLITYGESLPIEAPERRSLGEAALKTIADERAAQPASTGYQLATPAQITSLSWQLRAAELAENTAEAIDSLKALVAAVPEAADFRIQLIALLRHDGQFDIALDEARLAAALFPGNPQFAEILRVLTRDKLDPRRRERPAPEASPAKTTDPAATGNEPQSLKTVPDSAATKVPNSVPADPRGAPQ